MPETVRTKSAFTALAFEIRAVGVDDATYEGASAALNDVLAEIAAVRFIATDEDLALDVKDFDAQLLEPAMRAIRERITEIERDIAEEKDNG